MNNPYYKVTKIDYISGEIEESNRVENLGEFFLNKDFEQYYYQVEKLLDEEYEETED